MYRNQLPVKIPKPTLGTKIASVFILLVVFGCIVVGFASILVTNWEESTGTERALVFGGFGFVGLVVALSVASRHVGKVKISEIPPREMPPEYVELTYGSGWRLSPRSHVPPEGLAPLFATPTLFKPKTELLMEDYLGDARSMCSYYLSGLERRRRGRKISEPPMWFMRGYDVVELQTEQEREWFFIGRDLARRDGDSRPKPTRPEGGFRFFTQGPGGRWELYTETENVMRTLLAAYVIDRAWAMCGEGHRVTAGSGSTMLTYGDPDSEAGLVTARAQLLQYIESTVPPRAF